MPCLSGIMLIAIPVAGALQRFCAFAMALVVDL